ncbi:bacteriophage antitermination protein Q [Salmonella enterica]|nr:bacteriophage antitermination protein Q [Salmonella enterica]
MTPQTITWVRNNVIFALNCGEKPQRGQLAAFEGFARATSKRYGRHRERTLKIGNRWYCRETDPVYALETARSKNQPDIITPEEFSSASWRRAIYSLDDYEKAWVLHSYGRQQTYMNHMLVCEYVWLQMHDRLRSLGKRVTNDMTGNLITMVRIAAWNAGQLAGGKDNAEIFAATWMAQEIEVSAPAWSQNYKKHWKFMYDKCAELDHDALGKLMRKM